MTEARKRALVVAYYLSRCDRKGCQSLGFQTWTQAFREIGETLGVPPNTVKQMRESFDPFCSVVRVGWYQRPPVRSRVQVMDAYGEVSDEALYEIARDIIQNAAHASEVYTAPIGETDGIQGAPSSDNLAYAARLRTGEAAEDFFRSQYPVLPQFAGLELEDTRRLGTGFDFRLHGPDFVQAVEVKGMVGQSGSVSFTDREWSVARYLSDAYILALVRSVYASPVLEFIVNPAVNVVATRRSVQTVSVYWSASF